MEPTSHFSETETDGRQRRTTILAYPKFYRHPAGWRETRERFAPGTSGTLAEATEGVHTLRVGSDGTLVMGHLGGELRQRLVGIAAVNPAGEPSRILDIDLAACLVAVEGNRVTWTHPDGYRYEVLYVADMVIDRLTIPVERFAAIRGFLPAGAVAFGPVFDFDERGMGAEWTCDAADLADTAGIAWTRGGRVKQSIRPARVNASDEHPGWAKRRILRRGNRLLVEAIPIEALDGPEPLVFNTTVQYQEGVSGYSGCQDVLINTAAPTTNYNTLGWLATTYDATPFTHRTLILFDLSALSGLVGSINSATLSLYYYSTYGSGGVAAVSARVLRNWAEATATWNTYDGANAWTTAGCDSVGNDRTATGYPVTVTGVPTWINWDVAAWAEDWLVDADPNHGVLLRLNSETGHSANKYYDSENGTPANRPKLTIDYTTSAGNPRWYYQRNAMRRAN